MMNKTFIQPFMSLILKRTLMGISGGKFLGGTEFKGI